MEESSLNSRDRVIAALNLEEPDRVPIYDNIWTETIDKWRTQGFPPGVTAKTFFGFEISLLDCSDLTPRYQGISLRTSQRKTLVGTSYGSVGRDGCWIGMPSTFRTGGLQAEVQPLVKDQIDFKEKVEPYLDVEDPRRLYSPNSPFRHYLKLDIEDLKKENVTLASVRGPYVYCVSLCGVKGLLSMFHRNPRLVQYMMKTISEFLRKTLEYLVDLGMDGLWMRDDMAYKNGPFFSPKNFRDLVMPSYSKITRVFRKKGLPVILHSDGDIRLLIPDLIKSGVTGINPLEVSSGMNVSTLKEKYGKELSFVGGIDKMVLSESKAKIGEEVRTKLRNASPGGGYILGSDHSVPPEVPLKNYVYMIKIAEKYGRY